MADETEADDWLSLCDRCDARCRTPEFQDVFLGNSTRFDVQVKYLQETSEQCWFCDELRILFDDWEIEEKETIDTLYIQVLGLLGSPPDHVFTSPELERLRLYMESDSSRGQKLLPHFAQFYSYADPDNHASNHISTVKINNIVSSDSSWDKARRWLTECFENHSECPQPENPLPTRVIDVSSPTPRLYESRGIRGHYAALSYCWGADQPHKTSKELLSAYMKSIDCAIQPQVLQEAFVATRNLGLQYIWIDSLCIIQDDEVDKRHEISHMREVYRNSAVTIVAGNAQTAFQSFLADRPAPPPARLRLPYLCKHELWSTILFRHDEDTQYDPSEVSTEQRAWCFEEKLLSPRLLIYAPSHLRWRCQTKDSVNGGHVNLSIGEYCERLPLRLRQISDQNKLSGDELEAPRTFWTEAVEDYTKRLLTKPRDKLIAIAGIADQYQRATGDVYLAGIWKDFLSLHLQWYRPEETELLPRPSKYRAPSWSWASTDCEVGFYATSGQTTEYEIVQCETTPTWSNLPCGPVSSGRLTVRGRLCNAILDCEQAQISKCGSFDEEDHVDVSDLEEVVYEGEARLDSDELAGQELRLVFCFHCSTEFNVQQGFILVKSQDPETGLFRRIGFFMADESVDWFTGTETQQITIT